MARKTKAPKTRKETWDLAKSAARKVVNTQFEKHFFDNEEEGTAIDIGGLVFHLTPIPVGDQDTERSGDRITIKSLQIKWTVGVADNTNRMRIIVFQYLGDSAVAGPDVTSEIIQAAFVGSANAINAPYAKDFAGYKVMPLYDKTISLSTAANPVQHGSFILTSKDFKGRARPFIQYQGGGNNNIGGLYLYAVSDSGAASHPVLNYVSRVRYIDN
jgi:hypothetical protein